MSQLFTSGGQSIRTSASVLLMNIQGWYPLGLTVLITLQFKGLSRVFSSTTIWKHQFFSAQPSLWFNSHISTWLKNHNFDYMDLWIWKMALVRLGSRQRILSRVGQMYSKFSTYKHSNWELSEMQTCIWFQQGTRTCSINSMSGIAACPPSPIADDPPAPTPFPSPTQ